MTREIWAHEHLVSYLAGGLTTEERYEIQERLKTDAELAAALEELRGFDEQMRKLFAASKPPIALEDRVIQALRKRSTNAMRGAAWPTRGMLIAASVLVVVLGTAAGVAMFGGPGLRMAANGLTVGMMDQTESMKRDELLTTDLDLREPILNYNLDRRSDVQIVDGSIATLGQAPDASGGKPNKGKEINGEGRSRSWSDNNGREGEGAVSGLGPTGKLTPDSNAPTDGWNYYRSKKDFAGATRFSANVEVKDGLGAIVVRKGDAKKARESLEKLIEEEGFAPDGRVATKKHGMPLHYNVPIRSGESKEVAQDPTATPPAVTTAPPAMLPPSPPASAPFTTTYGNTNALGKSVMGSTAPGTSVQTGGSTVAGPTVQRNLGMAVTPQNFFSPADAFREMMKKPADATWRAALDDFTQSEKGANVTGAPPNGNNPVTPAAESGIPKDDKAKADDLKNALGSKEGEPPQDKPNEPNKAPQEKIDPKQPEAKPEPKPLEKQPEPKQPTARRIVIRSGDIEFEVDSFDQAVGIIYKVIGQTKGGVISTTNSDKLPNGKMRGTVVVRMPPEELDDFVANMRRDLGKIGELKNQRIGSQDVTKHYTDMESELRGLRVSEDRLIVMLKDTKGKLNELLAVETQLAKTRTHIEKLEGELRYTANLAAMSTLTINLNEKEIRVAAGVVESELVQAGIETEDVDKAFQEAKAAIDEFKGRVFKSEMKQRAAGQFNAILQFEIAPESAGLMRDRLKQIGTVARLEIDRVQRVEGGGAPSRDSKVKRGDTQFAVSIYNLANVEPRETVVAVVVGSDVAASYKKLRGLIAQVKGTLRNTSLKNETRNVVGVLDFVVLRADEAAVQAALAEAGDILTRTVERKVDSDKTTDTRVGFSVQIVSVGGITARESNVLSLAAVDVPASFRKVRDAVVKAKGYMRQANLQETDKANITAHFDFDVLRADEDAILAALAGAGETLTRTVERRAEGDNVTDAKIGFRVSLQSVASIGARESIHLEIAATDVPAAFAKLREAAARAKAQVRTANLKEDENMTATLDFDVLRADEDTMLTALATAGEQLSRQVDRQANAVNVTDAKVFFSVRLKSASAIEPREVYVLHIKVNKVEEKLKVFQSMVNDVQGKVVTGPMKKRLANGKLEADITYNVPLISAGGLVESFKKEGVVVGQNEGKNPKAPEGKLALAQIQIKLFDAEPLMPSDEGFGAQLRSGMSLGLRGLSLTISYLLLAIVLVGPWLLVVWIAYRLIRRRFANRAVATTEPSAAKS
jgi:hypothetical protein